MLTLVGTCFKHILFLKNFQNSNPVKQANNPHYPIKLEIIMKIFLQDTPGTFSIPLVIPYTCLCKQQKGKWKGWDNHHITPLFSLTKVKQRKQADLSLKPNLDWVREMCVISLHLSLHHCLILILVG